MSKLLDRLEYLLPAVTISVGFLVALLDQVANLDQSVILRSLILIVTLLGTSTLIERYKVIRRIESASLKSEALLTRLTASGDEDRLVGVQVYPIRDYQRIRDLLPSVSSQFWILGSTAYNILLSIRPDLISALIAANFDVRILLEDADSPFLREQEREEDFSNDPSYKKNQNEIRLCLGQCDEIIRILDQTTYSGTFEVRQYSVLPFYSLVLFDSQRALNFIYAYGHRSTELPMIEVTKDSVKSKILYDTYQQHFLDVWNVGQTVKLFTEGRVVTGNSHPQANGG